MREITSVNLDSIGEALNVPTNRMLKTDPEVTIEQQHVLIPVKVYLERLD